MTEPTNITAGDAVAWERPDANADGTFTFSYRLVGPAVIEIGTTAVDGLISVTVDSTTTAAWTAGEYKWFLSRSKSGDRVTVDTGYLTIDADPVGVSSLDNRSHAERMLALIDQRLEGRISSDHERYSIDGRSLDRIPIAELRSLRKQYAWAAYDHQVSRGLRTPHRKIRHR